MTTLLKAVACDFVHTQLFLEICLTDGTYKVWEPPAESSTAVMCVFLGNNEALWHRRIRQQTINILLGGSLLILVPKKEKNWVPPCLSFTCILGSTQRCSLTDEPDGWACRPAASPEETRGLFTPVSRAKAGCILMPHLGTARLLEL